MIDGYWVYRSSADITPFGPASRLGTYYKQPASNIGALTCIDRVTGTYYYWVSSVSVTGLESSLTPALNTVTTTPSYPTVEAGDATASACDGNESTSTSQNLATNDVSPGATSTDTATWSGFSNASGPAEAQTLKVLVGCAISCDNPPQSGGARCLISASASFVLQYSIDSGAHWTEIAQINYGGNGQVSLPTAYISAPLLATQDLTLFQVQTVTAATAASPIPAPYPGEPTFIRGQATIAVNIYEIRVDIEQETTG